MKRQIIYILAFAFGSLTSCSNSTHHDKSSEITDTAISEQTTLNSLQFETFDTTIKLVNIDPSKYYGITLTPNLAKSILYKHFSKKGFFTADNLPNMEKLAESDNDNLNVEYDTILFADLNKNKNIDAVITYWLTPPYAIGHCWQPHKAIIIDTDKGYAITNEEFIPDNFSIDSLTTKSGQLTIWGYEYDCSNHKIMRNLRVQIE